MARSRICVWPYDLLCPNEVGVEKIRPASARTRIFQTSLRSLRTKLLLPDRSVPFGLPAFRRGDVFRMMHKTAACRSRQRRLSAEREQSLRWHSNRRLACRARPNQSNLEPGLLGRGTDSLRRMVYESDGLSPAELVRQHARTLHRYK